MSAPTWELFLVGNQCDNTRPLKLLSSFNIWRNFISQIGNNDSDVNLNISNSDHVLSYWFSRRRSSHTCANMKTRQRKRLGRGGTGPNRMKMWSSLGLQLKRGVVKRPSYNKCYLSIYLSIHPSIQCQLQLRELLLMASGTIKLFGCIIHYRVGLLPCQVGIAASIMPPSWCLIGPL